MGIYERQQRHHHLVAAGVWGDPFRPDAADMPMPMVTVATPPPSVLGVEAEDVKFGKRLLQAQQDDFVGVPASMEGGGEAPPSSESFGHDDDDYATRPPPRDSKTQRRLAQNREAARKSRLRKKAYIQNLETSRMKLAQLEQELTMARRHQVGRMNTNSGVYGLAVAPPPPSPSPVDPRIAAFEQEYSHWVEEQERQATELRAALQSSSSPSPPPPNDDLHLGVLVDAAVAHYGALFEAKARAARCDAFFVLSGVWRAPADRFFLWIGGFRPSDLLAVLAPHLGPLADHQAAQVGKLRNTARQLEDALAQGLVKLQQTLMETLLVVTVDDGEEYAAARRGREMEGAVGKLGDLVDFVEKADHLRQQTLRNMRRILTPRQAARGVLALADYGQRLRALSSLWAARPREPA